jgi:DNA-binding transcriptional LysR family regulator
MTLKQLEAFFWICHLGSFNAAALKLNTTQSAISMRIRELEDQLGVSLLDREMRNTRPTLKGRELLVFVERMMQLMGEIAQKVADPRVLSVTLTLGVTEFVAITWLADMLQAVNAQYPGVRVELDVDLTSDLLRKLEAGEIDIALVPGPVKAQNLDQVSVGDVDFRWMASPALGVPNEVLKARDLLRWPILTTVKSSNLYGVMSEFLGSDIHARSTTVCNTIGVMGALTLAGLGLGFLPRAHYAGQIDAGRLRVLNVEPVMPPLRYFAVCEERRAAPLLARICELARETSSFERPASGKAGATLA